MYPQHSFEVGLDRRTTADDVLHVVQERFRAGPFRGAVPGRSADVAVSVSLQPEVVRIHVNRLSFALAERLEAAFATRVSHKVVVEASASDPVLAYVVDPIKNQALFAAERAAVIPFVRFQFPIVDPQSAQSIQIVSIRLQQPPPSSLSSRYVVVADLARTEHGAAVETQTVALCNFFGPDGDGLVGRPGRGDNEAIDDTMARFRYSVRSMQIGRAHARLARLAATGDATIHSVLDLDD